MAGGVIVAFDKDRFGRGELEQFDPYWLERRQFEEEWADENEEGDDMPCEFCNGTGQDRYDLMPCEYCDGTGWIWVT